jgi:hypothetical protein
MTANGDGPEPDAPGSPQSDPTPDAARRTAASPEKVVEMHRRPSDRFEAVATARGETAEEPGS